MLVKSRILSARRFLLLAGVAGLSASLVAGVNFVPSRTGSALTSIVKNQFQSGFSKFDAANGGVGIAPYHDYDGKVTADVKSKIDAIQKQLAAGTLKTGAETS